MHRTTNPYEELAAIDPSGRVRVVIDTPRGSRAKYKFDEDSGLMLVSKLLPRGAVFPYNFGFVPGTRGEDGDALDVLVLVDEPLALGCVAPVRLIGVIKGIQTEKGDSVRNDRLLGVIETAYNPAEISDISALHDTHLSEIEHFFIAYNAAHGRRFDPDGREGADAAMALVTTNRQ